MCKEDDMKSVRKMKIIKTVKMVDTFKILESRIVVRPIFTASMCTKVVYMYCNYSCSSFSLCMSTVNICTVY
jgi:hypothetical protein